MTNPPPLYTKNDAYRAFLLGKNDGRRQDFHDLLKKILWEREENDRLKRRLEKLRETQE